MDKAEAIKSSDDAYEDSMFFMNGFLTFMREFMYKNYLSVVSSTGKVDVTDDLINVYTSIFVSDDEDEEVWGDDIEDYFDVFDDGEEDENDFYVT
jgi:hypothetical protein